MKQHEEVRINFFRISRCGFYGRGKSVPDFSGIDDVLSQLRTWSNGSDLSDTKLVDPHENLEENPVYLFGIQNSHAGWVLATWNEIPSHETGIPSVPMKAKVGETVVHMNDVEEDTIPGFATYFWILPTHGLIATIKFKEGRSGQRAMVSYLGRFMSRYMKYTILAPNPNGGDPIVVGYTDAGNGIPKRVRPMFRTVAYEKDEQKKFLLAHVDSIRRVVRRGHVVTQRTVDRQFWQSAIRFLRGSSHPNVVDRQRVYIELDYRPTFSELETMIEEQEKDPEVRGYDDMGFILDGDSATHWLGRDRAYCDVTLTINRLNEEAVDIESLLTALGDNQATILQALK